MNCLLWFLILMMLILTIETALKMMTAHLPVNPLHEHLCQHLPSFLRPAKLTLIAIRTHSEVYHAC